MLKDIVYFIGFILVFLFFTIIIFEIIIRIKESISDLLHPNDFVQNFYKDYHKYINYYASWDDSLFDYDQIVGMRLLNIKNKNFEKFIKVNKLGFRTHEFEKKDDEFIIVFNGSSAAFGSGATSNETMISTILEKKLNHISSKKIKIYNLAQINNFQTQEIVTLIFLFNKLKPNMVLSLNGWNELTANNIMSDKTIKKYQIFNITELEGWKPPAVKSIKIKNFLSSSYLFLEDYLKCLKYFTFFKASNINKRDRDKKNYRNFEQSIREGSKLYIKNLEIFKKLSIGFNFKYFSFLQPYITEKKLTSDEKKLLDYRKKENPLLKNEDMVSELYKIKNIYKFIDEDSKSNKSLKLFNLYDVFKNEDSNIFYNMVHMNDIGQEIIANKIFELIKNEIPVKETHVED